MRPRNVPTRIDRYEIKGIIGAGGMGTLYLARDTNPNTARLVALKLLNQNIDSDEFRARFGREARALAALNHPNVVNMYDSGEYQFSPYIVMEYVRGETLAEKIKRRAALTLAQKLKLITELCAGLAHAHEAGIVHRDIKPANVMVDRSGRVKLLDFGIARSEGAMMTVFGPRMTQVNIRIGTPGYMSPEQLDGGEIDRRSDLFAVGAVMYELLSYSEAFSGATTREIEDKVLKSEPPALKTFFIPGLDAEIEAVVAKALEKDRDKRFQNASELERALERQLWKLGPSEPLGSAPRETPVPAGQARKRERPADVAYQRAQASYDEDAVEAAKRYALEALAEDPNHRDARRLLADLDPRAWAAEPDEAGVSSTDTRRSQTSSTGGTEVSGQTGLSSGVPEGTALSTFASEGTALRTSVPDGTALSSPVPDGTALSTHAAYDEPVPEGTMVASRPAQAPMASEELTVLGNFPGWDAARAEPVARPVPDARSVFSQGPSIEPRSQPAARPSFDARPASAGSGSPKPDVRAVPDARPRPDARSPVAVPATRKPLQERWNRSHMIMAGAVLGLIIVVATATALIVRWLSAPPTGEMRLTVNRPTGGTITGEGIDCGTESSTCTASFASGKVVVFDVKPDAGYQFTGYTDDCAADRGRVTMTAARTCSATFTPDIARGPGVGGPDRGGPGGGGSNLGGSSNQQLLSLVTPSGGTIVGTGIKCGSLGGECSRPFDQGASVRLEGWADKGFTFRGFTGDCTQGGEALMTGPRTCGAIFTSGGGSTGSTTAGPIPLQNKLPVGGPGSQTAAKGGPVGSPTGGVPGSQTGGGGTGAPGDPGPDPSGLPNAPKTAPDKDPLVAPPPAPAPDPPEVVAKKGIEATLERYRLAMEAMDYLGVQAVFPKAGQQFVQQFQQAKSIEFAFGGPPKYVQLDWLAGKALVEIQTKRASVMRVGPPSRVEAVTRFDLQKVGADDVWVITSSVLKLK